MALYQQLTQGEYDEIDGEFYRYEAVIRQNNGKFSFIPLTGDEMHGYHPIASLLWIGLSRSDINFFLNFVYKYFTE